MIGMERNIHRDDHRKSHPGGSHDTFPHHCHSIQDGGRNRAAGVLPDSMVSFRVAANHPVGVAFFGRTGRRCPSVCKCPVPSSCRCAFPSTVGKIAPVNIWGLFQPMCLENSRSISTETLSLLPRSIPLNSISRAATGGVRCFICHRGASR